jgi:hypothetical protein
MMLSMMMSGPRVGVALPVCVVWAIAAGVVSGCNRGPAVLQQQVQARQLAADLHVQFTKAADAANRAVMADTDEGSTAAAREAEEAAQAVQADVGKLQPIIDSLAYADEKQHLSEFRSRFEEYRKLDAEILPLAVQNTNLKAQHLSFNAGREAVTDFRAALAAAAKAATAGQKCCVDALVQKAGAVLLEIQVIQAQHIPESDDARMTQMEAEMTALDRAARATLADLQKAIPSSAAAQLAAASAALDRFASVNAEIVKLSRQNTNVRSLALSLGRKRTVTAQCDDALRELQYALGRHEFRATR